MSKIKSQFDIQDFMNQFQDLRKKNETAFRANIPILKKFIEKCEKESNEDVNKCKEELKALANEFFEKVIPHRKKISDYYKKNSETKQKSVSKDSIEKMNISICNHIDNISNIKFDKYDTGRDADYTITITFVDKVLDDIKIFVSTNDGDTVDMEVNNKKISDWNTASHSIENFECEMTNDCDEVLDTFPSLFVDEKYTFYHILLIYLCNHFELNDM